MSVSYNPIPRAYPAWKCMSSSLGQLVWLIRAELSGLDLFAHSLLS